MTLSEQEVEARLRRTLAAVAEARLDRAVPTEDGRRTGRRWPAWAAAAAVVAVVGVAAGLVEGEDRVTTVAEGGDPGRTVVDYVLSPEEGKELFVAEQRLVSECMERAGQPYFALSPTADRETDWSRLGRTDAEFADRLGYATPAFGSGRHPVMDRLKTDEQRNAWSMALMGEPYASSDGPAAPSVPLVHPVTGQEVGRQATGGCFGQANGALYGDHGRYSSLSMWVANDVRGELEQKAVSDPRFAEGVRAWAACMNDRGYDYDETFDPVNEFNRADDGRPTAREREVARADVECKEATGLVHVYRKLYAEHGRPIVAEHGALLAEYRAIVDRALGTARGLPEKPMTTTTTCCDRG